MAYQDAPEAFVLRQTIEVDDLPIELDVHENQNLLVRMTSPQRLLWQGRDMLRSQPGAITANQGLCAVPSAGVAEDDTRFLPLLDLDDVRHLDEMREASDTRFMLQRFHYQIRNHRLAFQYAPWRNTLTWLYSTSQWLRFHQVLRLQAGSNSLVAILGGHKWLIGLLPRSNFQCGLNERRGPLCERARVDAHGREDVTPCTHKLEDTIENLDSDRDIIYERVRQTPWVRVACTIGREIYLNVVHGQELSELVAEVMAQVQDDMTYHEAINLLQSPGLEECTCYDGLYGTVSDVD